MSSSAMRMSNQSCDGRLSIQVVLVDFAALGQTLRTAIGHFAGDQAFDTLKASASKMRIWSFRSSF